MFDVKEKIEEIVKRISTEKDLARKFVKDPVKTVEGLIGIDLPDEIVKKVIAGVKDKIDLKKITALLDSDGDGKPDLGAISKLAELLGKK